MKKDIHPSYDLQAKATCACGAVFLVGSTMPSISMEICSNCHPFYTGKQKLIDAAGSVDKFRKRKLAAEQIKAVVKPKKQRKARTKK